MSLRNWLKNGWLVEHDPTKAEMADLLAIVERDLNTAEIEGQNTYWQFAMAYNGALQAATVALAASGYRAARDSHHHRVIESLALTIGAEADLVRIFDTFRKKRNIGTYQRVGSVSDKEAAEMLKLAKNLQERVILWLQSSHADLFP
ncbi:MAG: hypothetical protein V1792_13845 [Pseudomonadota bacterium]